MKVRIGTGVFNWPFPKPDPGYLWEFVDQSEALGVDSMWVSDRVVSTTIALESMALLASIAARTKRMRLGNSVLALPLRNPVVLAKEIATIDFLSGGRMLPAFGIGADNPAEYEACGVSMKERGARTNEAIALMRRLWTEEDVTFHGRFYNTTGVTVRPKPAGPLPIWFGAREGDGLRRIGRLGDGWLASSMTPQEAAVAIAKINAYAAEAGRAVPQDHFGTILPFNLADSQEAAEASARPFLPRNRPGVPPDAFAALGPPETIADKVNEYVAVGITKFILRAACPPDRFLAQQRRAAMEVIPAFHRVS